MKDGWTLDDGESLNRAHPDTFEMPDRLIRENLRPGDLAKLVFRISVDDAEEHAVERMWVIVTGRVQGRYLGILDNEPTLIVENEHFWRGAEVSFEPRHVIDALQGDAHTAGLAAKPAPIPWKNG